VRWAPARRRVPWRIVRWLALGLICAVVVACDTSSPTLTTAPPGAPTTTIVDDTCDRLATDVARYLELVVDVLDDTPLETFRDPDSWPEALFALQQQGEALDLRAAAMGCDPAEVQARAFARSGARPDSGLASYLLGLLGIE
jgi:hypothetical protein